MGLAKFQMAGGRALARRKFFVELVHPSSGTHLLPYLLGHEIVAAAQRMEGATYLGASAHHRRFVLDEMYYHRPAVIL